MDNQKFEELQTTICRLSKENARLYEAYFEEVKKANDIAEHAEKKQKRIYELEKMVTEYENEQRRLIDERGKITKEKGTKRKWSNGRGKEVKDGECSTEARKREQESTAELQEARKKLIDVLDTLSSTDVDKGDIGVKRLGQLNFMPFLKAMERAGRRGADALFMASSLCTVWENLIRNVAWHPFKVVKVDGTLVEGIDDNDENLKGLLHDIGEEVYHAVKMALIEVNEYNPKGLRNVVLELWNFKEDRKATLKEGIAFLAEHYAEHYLGPFIFRDPINKQGQFLSFFCFSSGKNRSCK